MTSQDYVIILLPGRVPPIPLYLGLITEDSSRSTYCIIEANYWQTRSIARPFCDSRASSRHALSLRPLVLKLDALAEVCDLWAQSSFTIVLIFWGECQFLAVYDPSQALGCLCPPKADVSFTPVVRGMLRYPCNSYHCATGQLTHSTSSALCWLSHAGGSVHQTFNARRPCFPSGLGTCVQQPAVVCQECTVADDVPSRTEDCTFSVVVWRWLDDRDCTAQYNCCLPATTDCRRFCGFCFCFV